MMSSSPSSHPDPYLSDSDLSPATASRRQLYELTSDSKTRHGSLLGVTRSTSRWFHRWSQSLGGFCQGRWMATLVLVSMFVNVGMVGVVLFRDGQAHHHPAGGDGLSATSGGADGHEPTAGSGTSGSDAAGRSLQSLSASATDPNTGLPILSVLQSPEYQSLDQEYQRLKQEHLTMMSSMQEKMLQLTNQIGSLTISLQSDGGKDCPVLVCPTATVPVSCPSCPVCTISSSPVSPLDSTCGCPSSTRIPDNDLSLPAAHFDIHSHDITWDYCVSSSLTDLASTNETMEFCPEVSTNEQYFQLTFFDRPGAGSRTAVRKGKPVSPTCIQLPPLDYHWPSKNAQLPVAPGESGVHWPNLRVDNLTDLLVFNRGTPKNLYHFNASFYDVEQEGIVNATVGIIPWGKKVRLMLDVGAGGASLGLHLKRKYDVQVVSTVFADWPYCEYITERGNICMFIDAMEPMPFAKFSYDVVHASWVFHALFDSQLRSTYLEQNRILRPGGYMWIKGGWSWSQVRTLEELLIKQLGYKTIWEEKRPVREPGKYKFDTIPFELEWEAILLKPIRATCGNKDRREENQQQAV